MKFTDDEVRAISDPRVLEIVLQHRNLSEKQYVHPRPYVPTLRLRQLMADYSQKVLKNND